MRTGRPKGSGSKYTVELGEQICHRLAHGESLLGICKDEGMPSEGTVRGWCVDHADFASKYARARQEQADHYAEQIIEIADEKLSDLAKEERSDAWQQQRLRIDARKWYASKVAPKRYGDRLDVEHGGDVSISVVSYAKPTNPA